MTFQINRATIKRQKFPLPYCIVEPLQDLQNMNCYRKYRCLCLMYVCEGNKRGTEYKAWVALAGHRPAAFRKTWADFNSVVTWKIWSIFVTVYEERLIFEIYWNNVAFKIKEKDKVPTKFCLTFYQIIFLRIMSS